MARCSSCDAELVWVELANGKRMPCDARKLTVVTIDKESGKGSVVSAYQSHFATCPNADQHRRRR